VRNAVTCKDLPDNSCGEGVAGFTACGLATQSTGYHHISGYINDGDCSTVYPVPESWAYKTATTYAVTPPTTSTTGFWACGTACPTGFYVHSSDYVPGCSTARVPPSTGPNNHVWCKNTAP
jgi:hypothetical protein